MNNKKGFYTVFEGGIGSGKSTQVPLVAQRISVLYPKCEIVVTREPGGTPDGERIREIVKHKKISPREEAHLYREAREHSIEEVVKPALSRGALVVSDRSFVSSLAYQGRGRGLTIDEVWRMNREIVEDCLPDLVLFFDIGIDACLERSRKNDPDKFDGEDRGFNLAVARGYQDVFWYMKALGLKTEVKRVCDPLGNLTINEATQEVMKKLIPSLDVWTSREGHVIRERG